MMELTIFIVIAVLLIVSLLLLARERRESPALTPDMPLEDWFPRHAQYFSPIRRAISESDIAYLSGKVKPESQRQARVERRRVACEYLAGLREDFVHFERLSRTLAVLSPNVSRRLEWERVWLGLQFRGLYRLAWLRIETGLDCVKPLTDLTNVAADLASRVDAVVAGMEQISAHSSGFGSAAQGRGSHPA